MTTPDMSFCQSIEQTPYSKHLQFLEELENTHFPPENAIPLSTYKEIIDILPPLTEMSIRCDSFTGGVPFVCVGETKGKQIYADYAGNLLMEVKNQPRKYTRSTYLIGEMRVPFSWSPSTREESQMQEQGEFADNANPKLQGLVQFYILKWAVDKDYVELLPKPRSKFSRDGFMAVWRTDEGKARIAERKKASQSQHGEAKSDQDTEHLDVQSANSQDNELVADKLIDRCSPGRELLPSEASLSSPAQAQSSNQTRVGFSDQSVSTSFDDESTQVEDDFLAGDGDKGLYNDEPGQSEEDEVDEDDADKEGEIEEDQEVEVRFDEQQIQGNEDDSEVEQDPQEHAEVDAKAIEKYKTRAINALETLKEKVPEKLLALLPPLSTVHFQHYSAPGYLKLIVKFGQFRGNAPSRLCRRLLWAVFELTKSDTHLKLQLTMGSGGDFEGGLEPREIQITKGPCFKLNPAFRTARSKEEYKAVAKYYLMLAAAEQLHGFLDAHVSLQGSSSRIFVKNLRNVCERLQNEHSEEVRQESVPLTLSPTPFTVANEETGAEQEPPPSPTVSDLPTPGLHSRFTPINGPDGRKPRSEDGIDHLYTNEDIGVNAGETPLPPSLNPVGEGTTKSPIPAPQRSKQARRHHNECNAAQDAGGNEPVKKRRQISTLSAMQPAETNVGERISQSTLTSKSDSGTTATQSHGRTEAFDQAVEQIFNDDDTTLVDDDPDQSQSLAEHETNFPSEKLLLRARAGNLSAVEASKLEKFGLEVIQQVMNYYRTTGSRALRRGTAPILHSTAGGRISKKLAHAASFRNPNRGVKAIRHQRVLSSGTDIDDLEEAMLEMRISPRCN
jgi:hypothetical protein